MKLRSAVLIIAIIILADQALKIWVKTNFTFGHITNVLGFEWFQLYFIENKGMAWGMEIGGQWGKMLLTLFRLVAVVFGSWYLVKIVREKYSRGFIICAALIYAGALGNLIDSLFYGLLFSKSDHYTIAQMFPPDGQHYESFLNGHVVDMLHFPLIESNFPAWFPFVGGESFMFFSPIFNIADASISIGVITLLLFQKRFFKKHEEDETHHTIETNTITNDNVHVM